ncbi:CU044_5270 family protein [Streptomyces brasiliscabiei]|uniref:CU044_5270 family protein n=1 Tax=Streptomyces brasiliscabiei TaxID=2736302 RepID=UPI0027DEAE99|nr:CU044_5270 family protein [Streptomyces brasiliscabiei]
MNTRRDTKHGRTDVMTVLADARPDELDPARLAGSARQREDLARIMAMAEASDERPARLRAPGFLRGGVRPLGAVVALAAVTAAAVVVSTLDRDPLGVRPGAPTRSPAAAEPNTLTADVRLELLSAAKKAGAAADEGTYWQTTTRSENVNVVRAAGGGSEPFAVRDTGTSQWSVGVRPGTRSLMVTGLDAETAPRTAADEARWKAAGSPANLEAEVPGNEQGGKLGYAMGPRSPLVMRTDAGGKIYAVGPRNVSYRDLLALPSGTAELRRELERLYVAEGGGAEITDRTAYVLRQAADLITMPVKPAVRAAAYRVIAEQPGVRGLGQVTDPLGREGVGVAFPGTHATPLGSVEQRVVVDPSTGELLCELLVLTEPSATAREAGLDVGATVDYSATTRMGWGERQITVPENARG